VAGIVILEGDVAAEICGQLMRYPCSYMVYSGAFDALPSEAKGAIYERMWLILSGAVTDAKYARLSRADRQAILEILRDTKTVCRSVSGQLE
jgi:hypothetical protein